jgi:hypothetical protein
MAGSGSEISGRRSGIGCDQEDEKKEHQGVEPLTDRRILAYS